MTSDDGDDDHLRTQPGNDILSEVLAAEHSIAIKLDAERQAARQWLERTRAEIEQAKLAELTALKASAAREQEAATRAVHDKAAAILQEAVSEADRIRRREDASLVPLVRQYLQLLVPGRAE